jgi:hypothetical protein
MVLTTRAVEQLSLVALAVVRQPGALVPWHLVHNSPPSIRPASRSQRAQSSLLALLSLPVRSVSIGMTLNKVTMLRAFASANAQRLARVIEARLVCDRVLDLS